MIGPIQFVPNVNVQVVRQIKAVVIKQNQALMLRALRDTTDREGNKRVAGEEVSMYFKHKKNNKNKH